MLSHQPIHTDMTSPVSTSSKPHFIIVPFPAHGHFIPMIDLSRLLADYGALVTVITTPFNAARTKTTISLSEDSNLRFVEFPFPCGEAGLPDGCEHIDHLPSMDLMINFFKAASLLRQPLQLYLQNVTPSPSCLVTDICHPWTHHLACSLNIPRLTFYSMCCLTLLSNHNISYHKVYETLSEENELFTIPGLDQNIQVTKTQAPGFFTKPGWEKMGEEFRLGELGAAGIIMNTFDDLEPSFIKDYEKAVGKRIWTVGPLSLYDKNEAYLVARGMQASADADHCIGWLDSMDDRSVIYVNFGSVARLGPSQLIEVGSGLVGSGHPFVWVVKDSEWNPELEELVEGARGLGLVLRGWAPQVVILSHRAVGGFMTHCGWNSTVEGVAAGVPMVTWPQFAEQFLNERLLVDVLRIGVAVGVRTMNMRRWGGVEPIVERGDVERAVRSVMDGGERGETRRKTAKELQEKAKMATREGGSSRANLTQLVDCYSNYTGGLKS